MSPTAIRRLLHGRRLRPRTVAFLLGCVLAVSLHHGLLAPSDGHHGSDMATVAVMCVAAFVAVGATVVAVAVGLIALGRWPACAAPSGVLVPVRAPQASARAGPELLLHLCISRR